MGAVISDKQTILIIDDSEIVLCQHGYEVGRIPCAEGSSCDRSGICSKDSARLTLAP